MLKLLLLLLGQSVFHEYEHLGVGPLFSVFVFLPMARVLSYQACLVLDAS